MQTTSIVRWLALAAIFMLAGCAQRESDVGLNAIPVSPTGTEGKTEIVATRSAEWDMNLSAGRGTTLQIGEAAQFKVVSAIRFRPNDILPDSVTVDTARIRFRVDQVYPARGNAPDLRMLIKQITEPWDENELRDTTSQIGDSILSAALPNRADYPVIDTLLLSTAPLDTPSTLPPATYWVVPDSIFETWLIDDSLNYGILLEAENPDVIVGIQSAEGAVDYVVQLEMTGTQFPEDSSFAPVAWSDTLLPIDDGYLANDLSDSLAGRLRISQGSFRRALLYFPVDSVASNPFRTVVRAWIHLYADRSAPNSLTYEGSNYLYKDASLTDTSWFADPNTAVQSFIAVNSTDYESNNTELAFEVTNTLAGIVGNPELNGGYSIQAALENDVLSRQFFHGHDSEVDSLRPRLEIWWVEQ